MSKISQTKVGVLLSYIMIAVSNILSLILIPIILKTLGTDEYGIYTTIGSLAGMMVILDFGMGSTVARYVAKYRASGDTDGEEKFLATSLIIYVAVAIIVVILGLTASTLLDEIYAKTFTAQDLVLARQMFIVLIINVAVCLPLNCFSAYMNGCERFVLPRFLSIARVAIRFAVIIFMLNAGHRSLMIVVVDTVLNFTMQLIIMLYVIFRMGLRIRIGKFDMGFVKEISAFSLIIFLTMVYDQIFWKVDQVIIGSKISKTAATLCSLGIQINIYYMRFSTAISEVFLPKVTKMIENGAKGKELTDFMIRIGRIQMLVLGLILCGVSVFGKTFYYMWTDIYTDTSWYVCMIVMIPLTVPLVQNMGIAILRVLNKHKFRSMVYFAIAVLNIFATIYLVERIGILGAPIATAIALTLGNIIIINIYYSKAIGIEVMRFFRETILAFVPLIAIMIGLGLLINRFALQTTTLSLIGWIAAFSVVYMVLARFITLNDDEKHLFARAISKIKGFSR